MEIAETIQLQFQASTDQLSAINQSTNQPINQPTNQSTSFCLFSLNGWERAPT